MECAVPDPTLSRWLSESAGSEFGRAAAEDVTMKLVTEPCRIPGDIANDLVRQVAEPRECRFVRVRVIVLGEF